MATRETSFYQLAGGDGVFTLFLSNLFILGSGGISWLWFLHRVHLHAKRATTVPSSHFPLTLVLGMRLRNNEITEGFAERLARALSLYREKRTDEIMVLGGRTGDSRISEAECGRAWLIARGVPVERIHIEDFSRHTLENLQQARKKLGTRKANGVILVSSSYHLARCHALATGLSLDHVLCAAESRPRRSSFADWLALLRESYFLHWYHTGWWWSHLINSRHSISRIR